MGQLLACIPMLVNIVKGGGKLGELFGLFLATSPVCSCGTAEATKISLH